jgi:hypothetical protein
VPEPIRRTASRVPVSRDCPTPQPDACDTERSDDGYWLTLGEALEPGETLPQSARPAVEAARP